MAQPILKELQGVAKSFRSADGAPRLVLDDVNFSLAEREIVALLGKSGSGKSTLLRIMAGLIPADAGSAVYRGKGIRGPVSGVAMVFQSFALFPWLTVQQNVELGLEAQGVAPAEREKRAAAARGDCPRAGDQSRRAADGRSVFRARRAHRRNPAQRHPGTVEQQPDSDARHPGGVAQYRG